MPRDVVVVFVHGIAVESTGYSQRMQKLIITALDRRARSSGAKENAAEYVDFREVFWADIVRDHQRNYLEYARKTGGLRPNWLHKLVIEGLGDAASYSKTQKFKNSAYYKIQKRLRDTISRAAGDRNDDRLLVVVAHSLGCQIVSTYAWDLHRIKAPDAKARIAALNDGAPSDSVTSEMNEVYQSTLAFIESLSEKSPFERLDTFAGLVTMGCNIPLFTFTFGPQFVYPITQTDDDKCAPPFPGSGLDFGAYRKAKWLNYFSINDPLGYPLKPLNTRYEAEPLLSDHLVNSEGLLMRMACKLPFAGPLASNAAHQGYWHNTTVAHGTAELIEGLVHSDTAMPHPMFEV